MPRLLAVNLLLFLVPFVAYAGWVFVTRGRLSREDWPVRVVVTLAIAGAIVFVIGLVILTSFSGASPNETYRPATLVDGQLVPGGFVNE